MEDQIYEFNFQSSEINFSKELIFNSLGYKNKEIPQPVVSAVEEVFLSIDKFLKIQAGFRIMNSFSLNESKNGFKINDVEFNSGSVIAKQLRKASGIILFTATAGPELERWSKSLLKGEDVLKGYIVDAVGSEVVEGAVDLLEIKISELLRKEGLFITNRYSPGYCGWKVNEQHKLFSFFPDNFCGISLTDSALMIPIKSVSGVIGTGRDVKKLDYQCSICDMESCFRRKYN